MHAEVARDARPGARQRARETHQPRVFVGVSRFAPSIVISKLLSSAIIAPRRLEMSAGTRAYPDVPPRRWHGQGLDPVHGCRVANRATVDIQVGEIATLADSAEAGLRVGRVDQTCFMGGLDWARVAHLPGK